MSDYKLKILGILADRVIHEHNILISRNNIMLIINSAILTVAINNSRSLSMILLGLGLSLAWIIINILSIYWVHFWDDELKAHHKIIIEDRVEVTFFDKLEKKNSQSVIEALIVIISGAFIVPWLFLLFADN